MRAVHPGLSRKRAMEEDSRRTVSHHEQSRSPANEGTPAAAIAEIWEARWGHGGQLVEAIDRLDSHPDPWVRAHLPYVNRALGKLPPAGMVLEAGCGPGYWALFAAAHGATALGVDLVRDTLIEAQRAAAGLGLDLCRFAVQDIRALALSDRTFDLVLSFGVIEHFPDPTSLMHEMVRVLSPGGHLLLSTPNVYSTHTLTRPILQKLGRWHIGHEDSYTPGALARLAQAHGLTPLQQGVIPSGDLFGTAPLYLPLVGRLLHRLSTRLSLRIERAQDWVGFIAYTLATKR